MPKGLKKQRQVRLAGVVHCPKTFFMLIHNEATDKVVLKHQDQLKFETDFGESNRIVTAVNVSELSVYFGFLESEDRLNAYSALISLIAKAGRLSLAEYAGGLIPAALKQAYLRTVAIYKGFLDGEMATRTFIRKLGSLMMTVWRHGQKYLTFSKKQPFISELLIPELSTEYPC